MTTEHDLDWCQLVRDPIVTAEHRNTNRQIVAATEMLQQTARQFTKDLDERARLLANSAQFEAALRDAAAIRTILPISGIGYLCSGDVHCQQARYAAAIAVYDQGLEAVPDSDPYYQRLEQHRMIAMTNNSKRVDFISQLPLDIVITYILPRVDSEFESASPCELLYVSRAWQERILKQSGLQFHFGHDVHTFSKGHDQLVRFAPHVQKLRGSISDVHLDDLFSRANFSNLKQLDICCHTSTPHLPLLRGLQMVSDTLTDLTIYGWPDIQLRDILESCPNLCSLTTRGVNDTMPLPSSTRYPNMTHLALYDLSEGVVTYENMVDVLSRFPRLLALGITPMPPSCVLTVLHKHCSYLQVLYCGVVSNLLEERIDVLPNRKGIMLAHLGACMQDDMIQFLHLHHHSLETIYFNTIVQSDNSLWRLSNGQVLSNRDRVAPLDLEDDPAKSETTFKRLTNIEFWPVDPFSSEAFITWLISNAPNLKAVFCCESHLQPSVASALTKLKHLSRLRISAGENRSDNQGIRQLLEYHIAMGNQSTLEKMALTPGIRTSDATWLSLISRMKCLKSLELLGDIPKEFISTLAEIGQGCTALEELSLGMIGYELADGTIESLRQLANLKCLTVLGESLCKSDLFVLTTFPSLQQLYLRLDTNIPDYIQQMLRKHIAKVIIQ